VLLGDRPALTPVESFYQRMLAGDPDEAATQAELLLRDRPLSAYYDEVALRSLQMAAADAARGVLTAERQIRMRDAMTGLLDDLDLHEDTAPSPHRADDGPAAETPLEGAPPAPARLPPRVDTLPLGWDHEAPVLCIGGRTALDDAAAAMLAQILDKHGLPARIGRHEAVARAALADFDMGGVSLLVVSYMEITGSPAHLRSLLRRLRQRAPGAPLILALWPSDAQPEPGRDLRETEGADDFATTLRDVVTLCVECAQRKAPALQDETAQA
jgi:hypothetical protein